jgi:hypothetical protein
MLPNVKRAHRAIAHNTKLGIKSIGSTAKISAPFHLGIFGTTVTHLVNTLANSNKPI